MNKDAQNYTSEQLRQADLLLFEINELKLKLSEIDEIKDRNVKNLRK